MASQFFVYEDAFTNVDNALASYINDVAANIITAISPTVKTLLIIYAMLYGIALMTGQVKELVLDFALRFIKLSLIVTIALQIGMYNAFLSDMLWNSPDVLASYIASGHSDQTANAQFLDQLLSQFYDLAQAFNDKAIANNTLGIPDLTLLLTGIAIQGAGAMLTLFAAFLLILSKMALSVILGVGPLFVLMTMFEATKKFFDAWIAQALNYVFLTMLTAAVIKLIFTIIDTYLTINTNGGGLADPNIQQAIPVILLSGIGTLVLLQMQSISSALGGGVALSTMGAASWTYQNAKNLTKDSYNLASGNALSDMRAKRRQREINRNWAERNPSAPVAAARSISSKISGTGTNKISKN